MAELNYVLVDDLEPLVRLSDAALAINLQRRLGQGICLVSSWQNGIEDKLLWGQDKFEVDQRRRHSREECMRWPAVQKHMNGMFECPLEDIDRAILEVGDCIVRNPRNPLSRLRHASAKARNGNLADFIGAETGRDASKTVLIQPWHESAAWTRRFFVTGGEIVADSPMSYQGEMETGADPLFIPHAELSLLHAPDWMRPLTKNAPVTLRDQQIDCVRDFLSELPLAHAMIEVEAYEQAGRLRAVIKEVSVNPPGAELTFWACPERYAEGVVANLALIEPALDKAEGPGW